MLCAFVDGAAWLASRSLNAAKAAMIAALGISIWTSEYYSPTSPGYFLYRKPTAADAEKERLLAMLPSDASIYSDDAIFAHLGMHPNAAIDPAGQQYVVYDAVDDAAQWQSVQNLTAHGGYRIVARQGSLIIFQRESH